MRERALHWSIGQRLKMISFECSSVDRRGLHGAEVPVPRYSNRLSVYLMHSLKKKIGRKNFRSSANLRVGLVYKGEIDSSVLSPNATTRSSNIHVGSCVNKKRGFI